MELTSNTKILNSIESILNRYPIVLQLFRFVAIGVLNYALDTIIFNFISKHFGISQGAGLGVVNIPGFIAAVIQSYVWNHYWTFGAQQTLGLFKNFLRLVLVGALGFLAILLILLGAKAIASPGYYLLILGVFVIAEIILWASFGLRRDVHGAFSEKEFVIFIVVSVIGLLINSFLLALFSNKLAGQLGASISPDLIKNIAKIFATVASLVWNFIGYKLFVFKR